MKHEFSDILVLIPAYDPDEKMISYVRNLEQEGFGLEIVLASCVNGFRWFFMTAVQYQFL